MNTTVVLVGLVHWNPHWQCFSSNPDCTTGASAALDRILTTPGTDFVSVIEFELPNTTYSPPPGWASLGAYQSCGHDWATLFYNSTRWDAVESDVGCVYDGRSFAAARFDSKEVDSVSLSVVGAHYPQTLNASTHAYDDATAVLKSVFETLSASEKTAPAILLADTNTESPAGAAVSPDHHGVNKTNKQLASDLGIWHSQFEPPSTPLYYGCCYSDGFQWQGDRIISNAGSLLDHTVLFDPVPSWAAFEESEFHKGVRAMLKLL